MTAREEALADAALLAFCDIELAHYDRSIAGMKASIARAGANDARIDAMLEVLA